jgi:hypothetical protein
MSAVDAAVAVAAALAGFAAGYGFRGWFARRLAGRRAANNTSPSGSLSIRSPGQQGGGRDG